MLPTQKPTYRMNKNGSFMHDAVNICIHFIKFDFPEKAVMFYKELVNYHMTKKMIPYIDVEGNLARHIPEAVSNPRFVCWRALIMSQLKAQRNPQPGSTPAPAYRHTGTPAHRHTGTPAHRHTSENPWCIISPASSVQPASNFLAK